MGGGYEGGTDTSKVAALVCALTPSHEATADRILMNARGRFHVAYRILQGLSTNFSALLKQFQKLEPERRSDLSRLTRATFPLTLYHSTFPLRYAATLVRSLICTSTSLFVLLCGDQTVQLQ